MVTSQKIVPAESGVVITATEEVRSISSYATIFVVLKTDATYLCEAWEKPLSFVETKALERFSRGSSLVALLEARTHYLREKCTSSHRPKRGAPLGFIGDIGSSLFGIAKQSDVKAIAEANNQLAKEVEGVVQTQQKVVAKVNLLGRAQQTLATKMKEVIEYQALQADAISKISIRQWAVMHNIEKNEDAIRMNILLDIVEDQINTYRRYQDQADLVRAACESRIVSENVVPVRIVRQLMTHSENRVLISPMSYYQYMQVEQISVINGETYCIIKAPLLAEEELIMYHLSTFPVCTQSCVRVYHDITAVMGTRSEDIYFPEQCFGSAPRVCQPGVIYSKSQQPCLHGLITDDPEQQKQCPMTYTSDPGPPHPIITTVVNRYVLRTEGTFYHYRCRGKTPRTAKIEAGTYIITVDPYCDLDAGYWLLKGLGSFTINLNYTIPEPRPIPLTLFQLSNSTQFEHIKLPPGVKQLEFPTYEDLVTPQKSDIADKVEQLQKDVGKNKLPKWLFICIILGSVILGLVALYFLKKTCCPTFDPCTVVKKTESTPTVHYRKKVAFSQQMPPATLEVVDEDDNDIKDDD